MKNDSLNRRMFIASLLGLPFALFTKAAWAAKKSITSTEVDAAKSLVKESSPMPSALKYKAEGSKAAGRTNASANCGNCMHYAQAVGSDGKEIKVKGELVGTCALFDGGKGMVAAKGWCLSWVAAS